MTAHDAIDGRGFAHEAVFYRSDQEYLDGLVPFIERGLALRQPVVAAVPPGKLRLLRDALGSAAERVTMVDMTKEGRNPGRIIACVLRKFADAYLDRHVRLIGEPIWPGRTASEYPACVQHEALINTAFVGRDATILCPYDSAGLDADMLADARATHPLLRTGGTQQPSREYAPDAAWERHNQPLPPAAGAAGCTIESVTELGHARQFATETARSLGLAADRIADLQLIADELVTNSLRHTNGGCRIDLWREDGHLVCAVTDTGRLTDPLAGRRPATHTQHHRGLLLVNGLADLIRTHTSSSGTTSQAHLRIP